MSKRLASEFEQDGVAATAQAVWALITGQRNQIEGLEAATSGSAGDQSPFLRTARLVSPASRRSIDSRTVRIPLMISQWDLSVPNTHTIAFVSRSLADQLDAAARLPDYAPITGSVAQFVSSYLPVGGLLWVASRHRTTLYQIYSGQREVTRFMGYTRDYGLRMLNEEHAAQIADDEA